MIKSNVSKKDNTAATIFQPNVNLWKTDILTLFQSVSILAIVRHSHFLTGFNKKKTFIVQLLMINAMFLRFPKAC